ncbi:alpha-ketoglutarate-dependent dioxygenase AlkB, partial [Pseudomonas aeruginosa]
MDLFADAPLTQPDADLRNLPHSLDAPLASATQLRQEQ